MIVDDPAPDAAPAVHVPPTPGPRYRVRVARASDEESLRRMLERTTPEDIHLRFFRHMRLFPHELVAALLRADDARHIAVVAVADHAPRDVVASAMLVAEPDGRAAEFGIIVDRSHAGRRLGTYLMKRLLKEARAHGFTTVYGTILAHNAEMIDLVRRLGFRIASDKDDPGCVRAEIDVSAPEGPAATAA